MSRWDSATALAPVWTTLTGPEAEETDAEVSDLAASLGQGVAALVGDIKAQVEKHGENLTPDTVHSLALNQKLVESVRANIEGALMRSYAAGRLQARRAVEAAKARDVTSDDG